MSLESANDDEKPKEKSKPEKQSVKKKLFDSYSIGNSDAEF